MPINVQQGSELAVRAKLFTPDCGVSSRGDQRGSGSWFGGSQLSFLAIKSEDLH